jgi:hypothetical protein
VVYLFQKAKFISTAEEEEEKRRGRINSEEE